MSRIQKAYTAIFREMLEHLHARRLQAGLDWLLAHATRLSAQRRIPFSLALTSVYEELAGKLQGRFPPPHPGLTCFYCDAGLGGLARWLRAAGYETFWKAGIDDAQLIQEARATQSILLTTDSIMMERRVLRDHRLPALWLPPTLQVPAQLRIVFRAFQLQVHSTRCMDCGGPLQHADKQALRERIPPRTYRWLEDYFLCSRCGKLFWHGSHWEKIQRQLLSLQTA